MRNDFTAGDKLALLERMIEDTRAARNPGHESHHAHMILRSLARDVRAATVEQRAESFRVISEHIDRAHRSRARIGYLDVTVQQAIAEAVLAHWPSVEQAFRRAANHGSINTSVSAYRGDQ
jgi:hypothetical protein